MIREVLKQLTMSEQRNLHRAGDFIFFAGVLLISFSLPLWNLGMSLGQFAMAGGWLMAADLKGRVSKAIRQPVFWVLTALFLLHITGLWNTEDMTYAGRDLRVKLPLLLMPLLFAAGPPLTLRQIRVAFVFLIAGVLLSTGAGMAAKAGLLHLKITGYRQLSLFISHIRLSLLINVSMAVMLYLALTTTGRILKLLCALFMAWCIGFLILLQSVTGFMLLGILLFAVAFYLLFQSKRTVLRLTAFLLLCAVSLAGGKVYHILFVESIREIAIDDKDLRSHTALGNPYRNEWGRKDIEQGRYVWLQYNEQEMDTAWRLRSKQGLWDQDQKGNMQLVTLMRYLTYMGYSKDAEGVGKLTREEIRWIEQGNPYPEAVHQKNNIITRLYELAGEYRNYYYNDYSSGQSLAQRLEYWKTAQWIIRKFPFTGVGTGDVPQAFQQAYLERESSLGPEWRLRAHNQYLTMAVAFGWPGLLLFVFILIYCFWIALKRTDLLYLAFLIIAAGSFLNEDTLETQAGVTFFAFLNGLLLYSSLQRGCGGKSQAAEEGL